MPNSGFAIADLDFAAGRRVGRLLDHRRDWVVRRHEIIELVDDFTIARKVWLHLDLGRASSVVNSSAEGLYPLTLWSKAPTIGLEIRDEAGSLVPTLGRGDASRTAVAALCSEAESITQSACSTSLVDLFSQGVLASNGAEERAALATFEVLGETDPLAGALWRNETFKRKFRGFARGTLLAVTLERAGLRTLSWSELGPLRYPPRWERIVESLGWTNLPYSFQVPGIAEAETYELEISAPPGFHYADARLELSGRLADDKDPMSEVRLQDKVLFRCSPTLPGTKAAGTVRMRLARAGLVRLATLSCLVIALVLSFLAEIGLARVVETSDATSMLLAIPGVVTLVSARGGEHPFFTKRMFALRAVVTVCALISYVAVFQIATRISSLCLNAQAFGTWPDDSMCVHPALSWWAIASWVCVLILAPAFFRGSVPPRRRGGRGDRQGTGG